VVPGQKDDASTFIVFLCIRVKVRSPAQPGLAAVTASGGTFSLHATTSAGAVFSMDQFQLAALGLRPEDGTLKCLVVSTTRLDRVGLVSFRGRPGDGVRGRYGGLGRVSGRGGLRVSVRARERDRQLGGRLSGL
jgi:hypothetical protein